jgi:hypothetical protein
MRDRRVPNLNPHTACRARTHSLQRALTACRARTHSCRARTHSLSSTHSQLVEHRSQLGAGGGPPPPPPWSSFMDNPFGEIRTSRLGPTDYAPKTCRQAVLAKHTHARSVSTARAHRQRISYDCGSRSCLTVFFTSDFCTCLTEPHALPKCTQSAAKKIDCNCEQQIRSAAFSQTSFQEL